MSMEGRIQNAECKMKNGEEDMAKWARREWRIYNGKWRMKWKGR